MKVNSVKLLAASLILMTAVSVNSQTLSGESNSIGITVTPYVSYVSSATIQIDPFSSSSFERQLTSELSGGYGYGISITKRIFSQDIAFGISIEYAKIKDEELTEIYDNGTARIRARIKEELTVIPVEFSGYFDLPDFTDDLNIYLGGGIGVYFGDRKRTIINIETTTLSKEPGFGFVVMSGMGYRFSEILSGVFELRFRQGEYRVKSQFATSFITAGGNTFEIDQVTDSKIFLDGLKVSFGLSVRF
ncbi:MAG: outer membrane beta-barrel protein [Ignavibacteria bacterium]|jgi:opacity protein-like surface antigen|nr:outer membrane beta-barrel protein [Ignavibacteria bacterium]